MPYLLASALSMALFLGVYLLVLRRLPFPTANRAYLVLALGLSLLVPLVEVPVWLTSWTTAPVPVLPANPGLLPVPDSRSEPRVCSRGYPTCLPRHLTGTPF
jgi:hypothetical protein